jgi:diguanylate cyclase (GGDEF)-like protein/PAS domain S-box-containing protein
MSDAPQQHIASLPTKHVISRLSTARKIMGAFLCLLLLAGANIFLLQSLLRDFHAMAATVNVAGKLRILSQKIAVETMSLSVEQGSGVAEIERSMRTFDVVLQALIHGGTVFGIDIQKLRPPHDELLKILELNWGGYRQGVQKALAILALPASGTAEKTATHQWVGGDAARMLGHTEALIDSIVDEHQAAQRQVMTALYALLFVDALILLLGFVARQAFNGWTQRLANLIVRIKRDKQNLKQAKADFRMASLVYQNSSEAMVVTDPEGVIVNVNPAFSAITGYSANEALGAKLSILHSGRHDAAFYQAMWQSLLATGKWEGEIWNRSKDGREYVERIVINTSYNDDGSVQCRIGLFSDVTQKIQSEALIWRQAHYDHLTGVPNRKLFQDRLDGAIARSSLSRGRMALVLLDLDFFKEVNDTMGHGMGDELLKEVAARLGKCVRATDTVARLGGDEFTLILEEVEDTEVVERLCRDILQALAQPYQLAEDVASISTSMGVSFYPDDGRTAQELLTNVDLAMYAAKERGRNQFCCFTPQMRQTADKRRRLLRDLVNALREGQFVLHYQPIVELSTGHIRKAEALIRWNHPELGLVGPVDFIPFAEDAGIIVKIGDWAFREAARQAALWRKSYCNDFQISVNVSPAQFMAGGLSDTEWLGHLKALDLTGDSIVVEITEGLLMDATAQVSRNLLAFRDAGIQVALDDFGTGYSSLSYLKKFNIDYIKIDRSFVCNLAPGTGDIALCEAIIVMAHRLGLKVIAEGVETVEQRNLLMQAGCDYGQGHLFSAPVDAESFSTFLVTSA